MAESTQKKLSRVRKPRVHITYDIEENGAQVKKELPFVVGVLGDFSGNNPEKKAPSLKDRKFVNIDRDNFDEVMAKMTPGVKMRVADKLKNDGSEMAVDLQFRSMEDFEPGAVVNQVKPLREMLEARNKLRDLLSKADASEDLEAKLEEILKSTESIDKIAGELGINKDGTDSE